MTRPLAGQAALVSGGSRGIGAAVARRLAEAGADVMVMYRTSRDAAEAVVRSCRMQGVQAFAEQGDVREYEDVKRIVRHSLWNFGHLSVVIHAAGVVGRGLVQDVNDQEYDRVMDTHVRGAFHLVRAALPSLLARRYGRIIFLSSIWGRGGGFRRSFVFRGEGSDQRFDAGVGKGTGSLRNCCQCRGAGSGPDGHADGAIDGRRDGGPCRADSRRSLGNTGGCGGNGLPSVSSRVGVCDGPGDPCQRRLVSVILVADRGGAFLHKRRGN